jgi:hypothetical protein
MRRLRALAAEPLVHFLLLGAGLFAIFHIAGDASNRTDPIVVSAGEVERLAANFTRLWTRPPSAEELSDLIDKAIREEVYYREAMAMSLDRNDEIIRRRLQQKLEFLSEDIGALGEPSEADLRKYLAAHTDRFRTDARLTFRQVYVARERRGAGGAAGAARDVLAHLREAGPDADLRNFGDRLSLPSTYENVSSRDVARDFGRPFAEKVLTLPLGSWEGPVGSGYGLHLVLVTDRTAGVLPPFSEVKPAVEREWQAERRREANESFYRKLRAKYTVSVELPAWARGAAAPASERVR